MNVSVSKCCISKLQCAGSEFIRDFFNLGFNYKINRQDLLPVHLHI